MYALHVYLGRPIDLAECRGRPQVVTCIAPRIYDIRSTMSSRRERLTQRVKDEGTRRRRCAGSGGFPRGLRTVRRGSAQVVTHRRHSRHGLGFASLGAVVGGDVAVVVVLVPGTGGGVTVGYASHSCRGRRTETNRLCMPAAAAALLASWPLSGLPCPFLSLPACLSLFLFLSLSFPFLFVLSSRVSADDYDHGHGELCVSATEKHFLVPLLPHFPGRSPRATAGHFRLFLSRDA